MSAPAGESHRVAVVQHPPVLLDRDATIARAVKFVEEAARQGAKLIAFPETFIPGYPLWVGHLRGFEHRAFLDTLYGRLLDNAVDLSADHLRPLRESARRHGVTVVCGIDERDTFSRGTIYNTVVIIGPDGAIANRHRKLVPTDGERTVWAPGDGSGLRVVDSPSGRLGALICWENYMPLARYTLFAQGVEVYVAPTWAFGDRWVASMRHIAFEGRCWVLGCGSAVHIDDVPADLPGRSELKTKDGWLNTGDSVIVSPIDGTVVAGPLRADRGILYADCDPAVVGGARRRLDVAGHYGRPDVFTLRVNRAGRDPIAFVGERPAAAVVPDRDPATDVIMGDAREGCESLAESARLESV